MKSITSYEIVLRYNKGDRLTYCRKNGYEWLTKMQANNDCMVTTFTVDEAVNELLNNSGKQ